MGFDAPDSNSRALCPVDRRAQSPDAPLYGAVPEVAVQSSPLGAVVADGYAVAGQCRCCALVHDKVYVRYWSCGQIFGRDRSA